MWRYLGLVLIVLIALGLAAGVGVILLRSLPERQAMRLTVFDGVAAVGGSAPRLRAMLEDADRGKPIFFTRLVVRFPEGWTAHTWSSSGGLSSPVGPTGLGAGPHDYTVGLPETHFRLDAFAHAAVWVCPADMEVVWFDAAAIVAMGGAVPAAATAPPRDLGDVVDAVKMLATGRQAVYLVAADPAGYASARRRLAETKVPPGPAFWVRPGDEELRLQGLQQVWPRVEGAVVGTPAIVRAAERLRVRTRLVPCAGVPEPRAVVIGAWRDAVERLSVPRGMGAAKER